jgi:hypothetical protein
MVIPSVYRIVGIEGLVNPEADLKKKHFGTAQPENGNYLRRAAKTAKKFECL